MTYATQHLRNGWLRDPEDSRASHRLQMATSMIEATGHTVEALSDDILEQAYTLADAIIKDRAPRVTTALAEQGERHEKCGRMVAYGELHWTDECTAKQ